MFKSMKTRRDLVGLLNYVRPLVYPDLQKTFSESQIVYFSIYRRTSTTKESKSQCNFDELRKLNFQDQGGRYRAFEIKKKSGKIRTIHAPSPELKEIQKCLNIILQSLHTPHDAATGFVPGKCIVDNAKIHQRQNYVYNLDLKDFFPSVDQARIRGRLLMPPFNLGNNFDRIKLASIIAILCCTSLETERLNDETGEWENKMLNVLPQGAPTSPTITNIICEKLDIRLSGLAKRFGCNYSRYADDITFSSMHNVYQKNGDFLKELEKLIKGQNFNIQESKTRLQKQGYKQEVTGLIVNESVNVNKQYIKQIRQWLYYWEQYGKEKAQGIFQQQYQADKGHTKKGKPSIENVLWGKLEYLKMVKGVENTAYLQLKTRLDKLLPEQSGEKEKKENVEVNKFRGIEKTIEDILTLGLDQAMSIK